MIYYKLTKLSKEKKFYEKKYFIYIIKVTFRLIYISDIEKYKRIQFYIYKIYDIQYKSIIL